MSPHAPEHREAGGSDPRFPGSRHPGPADIIAISGLAGSGKNTVSGRVARRLNWRIVEPTFKTLAAREGITLMQFQEKAKQDAHIDQKFDAALREECAGGRCVVSTWLGPWMAPGRPMRVWLDAPLEVRARRVSGRESQSVADAQAHIAARDADNRERYKKVYGIDIYDHAGFDLVLDASVKKPDELAEEIIRAYDKRLM